MKKLLLISALVLGAQAHARITGNLHIVEVSPGVNDSTYELTDASEASTVKVRMSICKSPDYANVQETLNEAIRKRHIVDLKINYSKNCILDAELRLSSEYFP